MVNFQQNSYLTVSEQHVRAHAAHSLSDNYYILDACRCVHVCVQVCACVRECVCMCVESVDVHM